MFLTLVGFSLFTTFFGRTGLPSQGHTSVLDSKALLLQGFAQPVLQIKVGDLWTSLQLMWLQFEVGPVGGRFWAGLGPFGFQIDPKRPRPDLGQLQIAAT